ncbi:efflux transporter outer membrane subunit [Hymenobacter canadensis]|uniref:Efflux transporter outer membrane subunit n=1 Tax=Hymenobacter canadensis TaxID=2999067 RepID=A0ABY7LUD4_9BACT|nr:efflux transporter outer membrane subunit [Hymenobacter canadensis]WBA44013.1 efflux transporter outer membrane subunit [Hymenobacter canadensis]
MKHRRYDSARHFRGQKPYVGRLAVLILGGLTSLLIGCVRGPGYQRPDVAVPAAWKNASPPSPTPVAQPLTPTVAPVAADQPASLPAWWEVFADPELNKLEEQALAASPTMRAAAARVEEARASVRIANSYRLPDITLDPQAYRTRLSGLRPIPFALGDGATNRRGVVQTQYYVPLNVSYEADVWGRLRGDVRAARADAQAVEADLRVVQLTLTTDAATYYFGLRALDADAAVLDTTRQDRQRSLLLTQARFKAGVDNEIAVRRAESELALVEATLLDVQRQRAGLENALSTAVGQPASAFTVAPRPGVVAVPVVPLTLPAALLTRRPDLYRAERQLAAAGARGDVARLARLPAVSFNGSIGPQSAELADLPKVSANYTYYLGGMVSIPIFNGGRNRATQQVVEARYQALAADYQQRALVAFQEVETALADVRFSQQQLAAQERAQRASRLAVRLTLERYRTGLTSYFEVVDANRTNLEAARLVAQNRGEQLRYLVQLVRALGGSWQ